RHTRFSRDWSSDVCSSDLATCAYGTANATKANQITKVIRTCLLRRALIEVVVIGPAGLGRCEAPQGKLQMESRHHLFGASHVSRSEERRVGKECRAGWWK